MRLQNIMQTLVSLSFLINYTFQLFYDHLIDNNNKNNFNNNFI